MENEQVQAQLVPERLVTLIAEIDAELRRLMHRKQAIVDGAAAALDVPAGWVFDGREFTPPADK